MSCFSGAQQNAEDQEQRQYGFLDENTNTFYAFKSIGQLEEFLAMISQSESKEGPVNDVES